MRSLSNNQKPLILVVNDDGLESAGFKAAVRAAGKCGEVLAIAPARQQTAMGRAYPRYPDLGIIEERKLDLGDCVINAYAVHSSPAHAVCYGALEIARRKPDLVVSGINHGANLGTSVTGSGTVGACLEAACEGMPSIALSLETGADWIMEADREPEMRYAEAAGYFWINRTLEQGMPEGCDILNVNVPAGPVDPEEYRITFLEKQSYYVLRKPPDRDRSKPYTIEFEIEIDTDTLSPGSDIHTVCVEHVISVTPLTWDITARKGRTECVDL